MSLSQLITLLYNRFAQLLSTAPKGAFSVTGLLGLALLVYGYLQLRGNDNRAEEQRRQLQGDQRAASNQPTASEAVGAARDPAVAASTKAVQATAAAASATPVGRAVAARLTGVKRVTLSIPGVVLVEHAPAQLQDSATVRAEALEIVHEISRMSDLYLLAHVDDDLGEAVVTGALEAAGILGSGPGQVKPHHVLCCSTLDGKVPIVRQLEPDLHIDGHPSSVDELKRFLPRLVLVREGLAGTSASNGNVGVVASLASYFSL